MPSEDEPGPADAKPIRWALGPTTGGDAAGDIAFRERASSTPPGERPQKVVVPSPMIPGAPEAIWIGEDGSRYVGGSFSGNKDFDTGAGRDFHKALGTEDGFVTCFDRNGRYRWTRTFGAKKGINVVGVGMSRGVVYALCKEGEGHVAILAMDGATGAPKVGFGYRGCQMFRCGQYDSAAAIQCHGETIYVAVHCRNELAGKLPALRPGEAPPKIAWPTYSFTVVLAIDRTSGSAVVSFGKNGVQTIGNAVSLIGPPSAKIAETDVEPWGLALSQSTLYVVGSCERRSLGIGGHGTINGEWWRKGFVAALSLRTGAAVNGFGRNGLVVMDEGTIEDAVASGDCLYLTGCWRQASDEKAFLAAMDAGTGALSEQFGAGGIKVFRPFEWETGRSIRVSGQVVYIAGGYLDPKAEGVYVAAFDRTSALPVKSFGNDGIRVIDGLRWGEQGRLGLFDDSLFLVARTDPSIGDKHEIKIGDTIIKHGEMSGFLFRLRKDGTVVNE